MSDERWLPVVGYEGYYEISSYGRLRGLSRNPGIRRPFVSNGYPTFQLRKDGKGKVRRIHKLVAEAFMGPCPEGMQVRHLDDDKSNNHIDNLQYGTTAENIRDAIRNSKFNPGGNRTKEYCKNDHEFSEENTYYRPTGGRACKECRRQATRDWRGKHG